MKTIERNNIYDGIELSGVIIDYCIGFTKIDNIPVMYKNQGYVHFTSEYSKNQVKEMISVRNNFIKERMSKIHGDYSTDIKLQQKLILGLIKQYYRL